MPLFFSSAFCYNSSVEIKEKIKDKALFLLLGKESVESDLFAHIGGPHFSFHPDNFSADHFSEEIDTAPFLEKKKIFSLTKVDLFSKENLKLLEEKIVRLPPWVLLVLFAEGMAPSHSLYKLVAEKGVVFAAREEKPWEKEKRLVEWLKQLAKKENVSLEERDALLLIKTVGNDSSSLKKEMEKLLLYGEISPSSIEKLVPILFQDNEWKLGEALFSFNRFESIRIVHGLLDTGVSIFSLIAHLRGQFYTASQMFDAYMKGGQAALVASYPYLKGKILEKKMLILQKWKKENFSQALRLLFEAEIKAKNSQQDPHLICEIFIAQVTRVASPS